jgi:FkbM family methyltransferase
MLDLAQRDGGELSGMVKNYSFTEETLKSVPFEGMQLYWPPARDGLMKQIKRRTYEPEFTAYLRAHLRPDMTFLDVGAHFGYYVLLAAKRCDKVIAVEPRPDVRAILWENIRRNGLDNVEVIETPLFSKAARGHVSEKSQLQISDDGPLQVVVLDSLDLAPSVIKIDVEGAEYDLLVGGEQTLLHHDPILLIEIHVHKIRHFLHKERHVHKYLRSLGYAITPMGERSDCRFIKAEKWEL